MKSHSWLAVLSLLIFVSCASTNHSMMRGSVAMKVDDSTGIACLESNQVKVGDTLFLFNNDCRGGGKEGTTTCDMVKAGEVEVTRLVNDHYSEFKTKSGVKFAEGSIISAQ